MLPFLNETWNLKIFVRCSNVCCSVRVYCTARLILLDSDPHKWTCKFTQIIQDINLPTFLLQNFVCLRIPSVFMKLLGLGIAGSIPAGVSGIFH